MFAQLSSLVRPAAVAALFVFATLGSNAEARDHGRSYGDHGYDRGYSHGRDWDHDGRRDHDRHHGSRYYYNVYPSYSYGWTGGYLTPRGYYDGYGYDSVYGYYGAYNPRRHCVTYSDRHGRYTVCD